MNEKKEEEKEVEEKVVRILTDEKLSSAKAMLEKDHAIDCIFLSMLGKGRWKQAKEFMKGLKLTLPDGTFRMRMMEIEYNGLVKHETLDSNPRKKQWVTTEFGKQIGRLLLDFFAHIDQAGGD